MSWAAVGEFEELAEGDTLPLSENEALSIRLMLSNAVPHPTTKVWYYEVIGHRQFTIPTSSTTYHLFQISTAAMEIPPSPEESAVQAPPQAILGDLGTTYLLTYNMDKMKTNFWMNF